MVVSMCLVATAMGAPGDTWILPIDHTEGGGLNVMPGIGWNGTNALQGAGMDGVRRVYWSTTNIALASGAPSLPASTELYTMEYYEPNGGSHGWQPIESRFNGGTETYPIEPGIPWAGEYGTNHQYIGAWDAAGIGAWHAAGPGPHTPQDATFNCLGDSGIYMWLKQGSQLYVKWDYPWSIDNTVSAVRLTQITPEPASGLLLVLGGAVLLRRRGR